MPRSGLALALALIAVLLPGCEDDPVTTEEYLQPDRNSVILHAPLYAFAGRTATVVVDNDSDAPVFFEGVCGVHAEFLDEDEWKPVPRRIECIAEWREPFELAPHQATPLGVDLPAEFFEMHTPPLVIRFVLPVDLGEDFGGRVDLVSASSELRGP